MLFSQEMLAQSCYGITKQVPKEITFTTYIQLHCFSLEFVCWWSESEAWAWSNSEAGINPANSIIYRYWSRIFETRDLPAWIHHLLLAWLLNGAFQLEFFAGQTNNDKSLATQNVWTPIAFLFPSYKCQADHRPKRLLVVVFSKEEWLFAHWVLCENKNNLFP